MGAHPSFKPLYKDHRLVARQLIKNPLYGGAWYNTRTWWSDLDKFKLNVLCEAESDVEASADALGRTPTSIAHRAKDFGLVVPKPWLKIIAPKRKPSLNYPAVNYPFVTKVRDEHADLLAVNDIIPKGIPENMRADMCQEIMLAILEGQTTLAALESKKANAAYFIKKFYHDNYEAGGHAISFSQNDEDWNSDDIASSVAAKEWRENQMRHDRQFADYATKTYFPPTQFMAVWKDQVGRAHLKSHELEQFLSFDEVEEIMDEKE